VAALSLDTKERSFSTHYTFARKCSVLHSTTKVWWVFWILLYANAPFQPAPWAGNLRVKRPGRATQPSLAFGLWRNEKREQRFIALFHFHLLYFAKSVARVSRITWTLICPGYSISLSILRAISLAISTAAASSTFSGWTTIRISRPAWMA